MCCIGNVRQFLYNSKTMVQILQPTEGIHLIHNVNSGAVKSDGGLKHTV